ncbi:MAG: HemK/PrmC family methyltransferase [Bdellovibrionales bacterium]
MLASITSVLCDGSARLAEAGVESAARDIRILLAHALGLQRTDLLTQTDRVLAKDEIFRIEALLKRREAREPVSRILGEREFWSLPFGLNEATLDPRPDSETLVEMALGMAKKFFPNSGHREHSEAMQSHEGVRRDYDSGSPRRYAPRDDVYGQVSPDLSKISLDGSLIVLDLGTGSGCLLLALLHELPSAYGLGLDVAPRAVEQAKINAERLGLAERATFAVADWNDVSLSELARNMMPPLPNPPHEGEGIAAGFRQDYPLNFDVIISNPPYIPRGDLTGLMPDVRDYDPRAALDGGEDGLDPYRLLVPQLPALLAPNGCAVFEVGQGQAQAVAEMFRQAGFRDVTIRRDLGGIERCVGGAHHIPE